MMPMCVLRSWFWFACCAQRLRFLIFESNVRLFFCIILFIVAVVAPKLFFCQRAVVQCAHTACKVGFPMQICDAVRLSEMGPQ